MYAYIKGEITEKNPAFVVIETAGIGWHINISLNTFSSIEHASEAKLYIHHIQREDVQALFGFATREEKEIFGHLLSVSGVGPNTARMVLSSMETRDIRRAIGQNDVGAFKQVKGVGPKTAQRILIDLRDKIDAEGHDELLSTASPDNTLFQEALSALLALGFPRTRASKALSKIKKEKPSVKSAEDLIKAALRALS
ncbi:MAG: Holliday junction branch migration protein RuvA [Saprospiraceae bacterium]|nr:Holliday junction branch migration protein RuvA [Saprospiraceae bacterium]